MVDDLIFANAIDAALDALEPIAATQATQDAQGAVDAETMVNHAPNGVTIANRTNAIAQVSLQTAADAQIVALRAAEAAWRIANP